MNDSIELILVMFVLIIFFSIIGILLKNVTKSNTVIKEPRILNKEEVEFMADYFHNQYNEPDYDGYVGHYSLPKEVMEIYNKKYGKERGFKE